jgi:hypothetical protein
MVLLSCVIVMAFGVPGCDDEPAAKPIENVFPSRKLSIGARDIMSMDIHDDVLVVGLADPNRPGEWSALLYDLPTGSKVGEIIPEVRSQYPYGCAVAIGDKWLALMGCDDTQSGIVVYDRESGQEALTVIVPGIWAGGGRWLALAEDRIVAGGIGSDHVGVAHLIKLPDGEAVPLVPKTLPGRNDAYGIVVDVSPSYVLVGASGTSVRGKAEAGAVVVFDSRTGHELSKVVSPTPWRNSDFGTALALDGQQAVVYALPAEGRVLDLPEGEVLTDLILPGESLDWLEMHNGMVFGSDIMAAVQPGAGGSGAIYAFSGSTGLPLYAFVLSHYGSDDLLGVQPWAAGDRWVAIADTESAGNGTQESVIHVFKVPAGPATEP